MKNKFIFFILGILVFGLGVWFFSFDKKEEGGRILRSKILQKKFLK
jgi:hypothetical protein